MIPSDERISHAMHALEQPANDVPDLFERVAKGARRRRRMKTGAAVAGTAIVVAGIAAVPALTGGTHTTHQTSPLTQPSNNQAGNGIDPGFTGVSPQPSQVAPTTPAANPVVPPAPTPLPTDAKGCPTVASIAPGTDAEAQARAAALAAAPKRYGADAATATVTKVYPAATKQGFGIVADAICGTALGDNSYVVELSLGNSGNSASMGSGQLFLANFPGGWQVWFQYH